MLITELAPKGSLDKYLKNAKNKQVCFEDVCSHLMQARKMPVHIATRNGSVLIHPTFSLPAPEHWSAVAVFYSDC